MGVTVVVLKVERMSCELSLELAEGTSASQEEVVTVTVLLA
jgi:hypothetical protein